MSHQPDRYSQRGVSSSKSEVHAVVDSLDAGLFPGAFCKIGPDVLTGDPDKCAIIHADGSGTKSTLAYLHYRETGDPTAFRKTAQDSVVMNLDDLLCVGVTNGILISGTINRNARAIPGEALAEIIGGTEAFLAELRELNIGIQGGGGETADVGDLTGTVTVDSCAVAVMNRSDVIDNTGLRPGLVIVGLASAGQANYEKSPNSGIGSNGLTSARHDLLGKHYLETYPETCDTRTNPEYLYCGPYKMEDPLPDSELTVGEALLSPTRTYAPIIRQVLENHKEAVHGLVHCSGGGQTKCLRFGKDLHFIKDNLLPVPPIFQAIRKASGTSDEEMFRVYNMGHRMEIFCTPESADAIIAESAAFGVQAQVIGRVEANTSAGKGNRLTLFHEGKAHSYSG
ncbi:MAG: AIR synthase-related protein [Opitutales bacterium]